MSANKRPLGRPRFANTEFGKVMIANAQRMYHAEKIPVTKIAKVLGVSVKTVYNYLKNDEFCPSCGKRLKIKNPFIKN